MNNYNLIWQIFNEKMLKWDEQTPEICSSIFALYFQMNRILTKNANRIKTLEERLKDTEEQAIEASRRVREQEECSLTKFCSNRSPNN